MFFNIFRRRFNGQETLMSACQGFQRFFVAGDDDLDVFGGAVALEFRPLLRLCIVFNNGRQNQDAAHFAHVEALVDHLP